MSYTSYATADRKTSKYYIEEAGAQLESEVVEKLDSSESPAANDGCSPYGSTESNQHFGESLDFGDVDQDLI